MITVYKNFLNYDYAKNLLSNIKSMPADWLTTAHKFNGEDVKYSRDTQFDVDNKLKHDKKLYNSMQDQHFTYRFKRSMEHVEGCNCFECEFKEKDLKGYMKSFIEKKFGFNNAVLTESFISCYGKGDFLSTHTDKQKGGVAFVYNLTTDWRPEYGGLLHVENKEKGEYTAIAPEFNSLVIMELGDGGLAHFVSEVSKYAPHSRISISGWYADQQGGV